VLLAEDDEDLRDAISDILRAGLGARVVPVSNARAALAAAREDSPDLAILDAGLPGLMDGWALARELKSDRETAWIRLIGLSGIGSGGGSLALSAGFDAYLGKERIDQLVQVVRGILGPALVAA
jgi:CheY-like chemotaxis protein